MKYFKLLLLLLAPGIVLPAMAGDLYTPDSEATSSTLLGATIGADDMAPTDKLDAIGALHEAYAAWGVDANPVQCVQTSNNGRTCIGIVQLCHMATLTRTVTSHDLCNSPAVALMPD